jgi:hypothetical protein
MYRWRKAEKCEKVMIFFAVNLPRHPGKARPSLTRYNRKSRHGGREYKCGNDGRGSCLITVIHRWQFVSQIKTNSILQNNRYNRYNIKSRHGGREYKCGNDGRGSCLITVTRCWQFISRIKTNSILQNNAHLYQINWWILISKLSG